MEGRNRKGKGMINGMRYGNGQREDVMNEWRGKNKKGRNKKKKVGKEEILKVNTEEDNSTRCNT